MRFNTIIRINNSTEKEEAAKLIANITNENTAKKLKKGIRLMKGNVTLGLNGTDYVEDKFSALLSFTAYKVPRFVSQHLLSL